MKLHLIVGLCEENKFQLHTHNTTSSNGQLWCILSYCLTIGVKCIKKQMCTKLVCVCCCLFIRDITEGKPLSLEVTGIEYMNDDPSMVDVLYAKVNVKDGSDK